MGRRSYTDNEMKAAIAQCVVNGSIKMGAKAAGVPRPTLMGWKREQPDFWERAVAEAWETQSDSAKAVYAEAVNSGMDGLIERINLGDAVIGKDGTISRVPVTARNLATIVAICQDKLLLLQGKPTSISQRQSTTTIDKLEELKQAVKPKLAAVVSPIKAQA